MKLGFFFKFNGVNNVNINVVVFLCLVFVKEFRIKIWRYGLELKEKFLCFLFLVIF